MALLVSPVRRVVREQTFRGAVTNLAREGGLSVDWQAPEGIRFDAQVIDQAHAWRVARRQIWSTRGRRGEWRTRRRGSH
jgi:hypothetical protein